MNLFTLTQQVQNLLVLEQGFEAQQLELLRLLLGLSNGAGAAFIEWTAATAPQLGVRIIAQQAFTWHSDLNALLLQCATEANAQQQLQLQPLDAARQRWLLITPVARTDGLNSCLALLLRTGNQPLELFATVLQLLAAYAPLLSNQTTFTHWLLNLQLALLQSINLKQSYQQLCDELQQYFQCQRVLLGQQRGFHYRLQAGSELADIQRQADLVHAVEALMDMTAQHGPVCHQATALPALQKVQVLSGAQAVVSVSLPLAEGGEIALVLWWTTATTLPLASLEAMRMPLAITLAAKQRPTFGQRLKQGWQRLGGRGRRFAWLSGLLLFGVVLWWPVPHTMTGQATLQPSVRRFVTAPFAGILAETLHTPGDVVAEGTVLAMMDGQEIEWTLTGLLAERNRLQKQKDVSAAARETAAAQIAQLEIERVMAQIALQEYRAANLAIKSPIAGILLSGDLKRVQGSPLSAGQSLFEIAPLQTMVVEVAVAAVDIPYLATDLPLMVRLNAYPYDTWPLIVERIQPRAVVQEGKTVFIVESHLANADNRLRPGMKGTGEIVGENRALVWVLFHRVWEDIIRWLR